MQEKHLNFGNTNVTFFIYEFSVPAWEQYQRCLQPIRMYFQRLFRTLSLSIENFN